MTDDASFSTDDVSEVILRREKFLADHQPYCPFCGAHQVRLVDIRPPAQWRCRVCKGQFEYEPSSP